MNDADEDDIIECPFCKAPTYMLMVIDEESIVGVDAYGVGWEVYVLTFLCWNCETEFAVDLNPERIYEGMRNE